MPDPAGDTPNEDTADQKPRGLRRILRFLLSGLFLFLLALGCAAWFGHLIWPEDPLFAQIFGWYRFVAKLLSYANFR